MRLGKTDKPIYSFARGLFLSPPIETHEQSYLPSSMIQKYSSCTRSAAIRAVMMHVGIPTGLAVQCLARYRYGGEESLLHIEHVGIDGNFLLEGSTDDHHFAAAATMLYGERTIDTS